MHIKSPLFDKNEATKQTHRLLHIFTEPRLRTGDLGLTARQMSYWESSGLIFGQQANRAKDHWRTFSLSDFHWIRIANSLRAWKVSFAVLENLLNNLRIEIPQTEWAERGQGSGQSGHSVLTALLAEFVITRANIQILITQDGQLFLLNRAPDGANIDPDYLRILNQPHISFPLVLSFVDHLLVDANKRDRFQVPGLLSAAEHALLNQAQSDKVESIKILSPSLPTSTLRRSEFESFKSYTRAICTALLQEPYREIIIQPNGGTCQSIESVGFTQRLLTVAQ